jgi:ankyrin repeat protein
MSHPSFVPGDATEGGAETELHGVAWTGELERARELIDGGADVNHVDSAGETAIHGAAANGNSEMVSFLLTVGARIDIPGTNAMTPLHWAAGWGNLETVRVLVDAGADISIVDDLGLTAEEVAVEHENSAIAGYLRSAHDA